MKKIKERLDYLKKLRQEILDLIMSDDIHLISQLDNWVTNLHDLSKRIYELERVIENITYDS